MLSVWVDTQWTRLPDGALEGRPEAPLPAALTRLAEGRDGGPLGLSGRAVSAEGMRLRAGLGYGRARHLAGDVALLFDPCRRRFRIAAEKVVALERRWAQATFAVRADRPVFAAGVGGTLSHSGISVDLARALGLDGPGLSVSEDGSLWARAADGVTRGSAPAGAPDAIVFHSDDLQEPTTLTVEATTACNFRCGFCYGRHIAQGVMRVDAFLAILDALPRLAAVEFTGEGEPMLNKDVPEMIRACKARGAWVHLTTNGSRMTRERVETIFDLEVDAVATSMETLDHARFARLRPGGDLDEVKRAMASLASETRARGRGPNLLLWVTLVRSSLDEIDAFLDYAGEAGFARVEFQTLNRLSAYRRFYSVELQAEILSPEELRAHRNRPSCSARARAVIDEILATHAGRRCDIFMGSTMVYWQGEVTPCRLLKVPQHPSCGNARRAPLTEIWRETGFVDFRFALQHGVVLNACDGCAYVAGA